jgi:hypothetical protein
MKRLAIILLAVLGLAACSKQSPTAVTATGQQTNAGTTGTTSVAGYRCRSYAFIAFHNNVSDEGVLVIDITKPEQPAVVCSLPGYSARVEYSGSIMCCNSFLCDVLDPVHPQLLSSIDTMNVECISLRGSTAYLGCGGFNNRKLAVVDIINPTHPRLLGYCILSNEVWGVAIKGNYAYVANHWNGLRVIDVSNPANPHEVANLLNLEAVAEDIVIEGHYAYLCQQGQVSIIDIANPLVPVRTATYQTGCLYWACIYGHYMYVANAYDGIQIVDVQNPSHPQFVSRLNIPGRTMRVAVSGDYAYVVGDNGSGLRIVNVRDKQHPFLVKSLLTDHTNYDITLYQSGHIQAAVMGTE